eukprot:Hpha_TRINITY_DN13644_c0_g1::TRINITY_DN13644_c0_g1_i1::g.122528::m.122528
MALPMRVLKEDLPIGEVLKDIMLVKQLLENCTAQEMEDEFSSSHCSIEKQEKEIANKVKRWANEKIAGLATKREEVMRQYHIEHKEYLRQVKEIKSVRSRAECAPTEMRRPMSRPIPPPPSSHGGGKRKRDGNEDRAARRAKKNHDE